MADRYRGFCWTLNNYTPEEVDFLEKLECQYMAFGREICPTTGTPHLQGYVYFKDAKSERSAIRTLPRRCHVEHQRAKDPKHAYVYCFKEDPHAYQRGIPPASPAEKGATEQDRWQGYLQAVQEGRLSDLPTRILCNNLRGLQYAAQALRNQARDLGDVPIDNLWIYGPPGSGKTTRVMADCLPETLYIKDTVDPRWDDYNDEPFVLIDDYDEKSFGGDHLKRWCGNQRFSVQVRYARMVVRPKRFFVTSNYHPRELFHGRNLQAILRRFTVVETYVDPDYQESEDEVEEPGPDWSEMTEDI